MGFFDKQRAALTAKLRFRHVKTRDNNGTTLARHRRGQPHLWLR